MDNKDEMTDRSQEFAARHCGTGTRPQTTDDLPGRGNVSKRGGHGPRSLSDLAKKLRRNRQMMRAMNFRTPVCTTANAPH